jgi:hypothetical protein
VAVGPAQAAGPAKAAGPGLYKRNWWPEQIDLTPLRLHAAQSNPYAADFSHAEEFEMLDLKAVQKDIEAVLTPSQPGALLKRATDEGAVDVGEQPALERLCPTHGQGSRSRNRHRGTPAEEAAAGDSGRRLRATASTIQSETCVRRCGRSRRGAMIG